MLFRSSKPTAAKMILGASFVAGIVVLAVMLSKKYLPKLSAADAPAVQQ